jgi:hypothetical protein
MDYVMFWSQEETEPEHKTEMALLVMGGVEV